MDQPGNVQPLVAEQVCAELQHADPDHSQRTRLPGAARRGNAVVHGGATKRNRLEVPDLPRRGPLGVEAAEFRLVVPHGARLARQVFGAVGFANYARRRPINSGVPFFLLCASVSLWLYL